LLAAATDGERAISMLRSQGAAAVDLASASFQLAWTYNAQGRYRAAAQLLEPDIPDAEQFFERHGMAGILGQQAFCLATLGEFEKAEMRGTEAIAVAETSRFATRPLVLVGLMGLGTTYLTRGEVARAAPLLDRGRTVALERDVTITLGLICSALGSVRAL